MTTNQDDFQRVTIRIPPELHVKIRRAANQCERSVNAEIITRLEASIQNDETQLALKQGDPYAAMVHTAKDLQRMAEIILGATVSAAHQVEQLRSEPTLPSRKAALSVISEDERALIDSFNQLPLERRDAFFDTLRSLCAALAD